jgi:UDP-N-acetylmuramoylalanine--D-glutamate ligase
MELAGKNIIVVGLGKTGMALARFLKKRGAVVVVTDVAAEKDLGSRVQELRQMGIALELDRHRPETFQAADLIVLSPGVPHTIAPVIRAQETGTAVMGEIELASRFIKEPIVAVTGTNGKTTTTELLGDMLKRSGLDVFVGGNIGNPLIGYVDEGRKADAVVAEISSFQLDTIDRFRPQIGVLLNITIDHLDRYPDFEAYAASKMRLFENQQPGDLAVLNSSDPLVRSLTADLKNKKLIYPQANENEDGAIINGSHIRFQINDPGPLDLNRQRQWSLDLSRIKLRGRHNLENACAAGLAAMAAGARPEAIQEALNQFQGGAHRLEYLDTIDDVEFYNDSKATNVDAVIRAVQCFSKPVVLIMGGLDKGSNFEPLRDIFRGHIKSLIVMGQAAGLIQTALGDLTLTVAATSMQDAFKQSRQAASPGDVVLLSPGCASFDMYDSYAQRGDDFRKEVMNAKVKRNRTVNSKKS